MHTAHTGPCAGTEKVPYLHHLAWPNSEQSTVAPPRRLAVCQDRVRNAVALMRPSGRWLADLQPPPLLRMKGGDTAGWTKTYRWLPLWERLDLDVLFQAMSKCPWWGRVTSKGAMVGGLVWPADTAMREGPRVTEGTMRHAGRSLRRPPERSAYTLSTEVGDVPRPGQSAVKMNFKITPWTHMNPYEVVARFKPNVWVARATTLPQLWISLASSPTHKPDIFLCRDSQGVAVPVRFCRCPAPWPYRGGTEQRPCRLLAK